MTSTATVAINYFDGRPGAVLRPELQTWMDGAGAAERLASLYADIVAYLKANGRVVHAAESCVNETIDFAAAVRGPGQWLEIVRAAQARGIPYSQGPAMVARMLSAKSRPAISREQREFLIALNYYRKHIEATPDWQQRLSCIGSEQF